jgi:hypothetical protein
VGSSKSERGLIAGCHPRLVRFEDLSAAPHAISRGLHDPRRPSLPLTGPTTLSRKTAESFSPEARAPRTKSAVTLARKPLHNTDGRRCSRGTRPDGSPMTDPLSPEERLQSRTNRVHQGRNTKHLPDGYFQPNDEHVHHYQRGRVSIKGLGL